MQKERSSAEQKLLENKTEKKNNSMDISSDKQVKFHTKNLDVIKGKHCVKPIISKQESMGRNRVANVGYEMSETKKKINHDKQMQKNSTKGA